MASSSEKVNSDTNPTPIEDTHQTESTQETHRTKSTNHQTKMSKGTHRSTIKDTHQTTNAGDKHRTKSIKDTHQTNISEDTHKTTTKDKTQTKSTEHKPRTKSLKDASQTKVPDDTTVEDVHQTKVTDDPNITNSVDDKSKTKSIKDTHQVNISEDKHKTTTKDKTRTKSTEHKPRTKSLKDASQTKVPDNTTVEDVHQTKVTEKPNLTNNADDKSLTKSTKDTHQTKVLEVEHHTKIFKDAHQTKILEDTHQTEINKGSDQTKILEDILRSDSRDVSIEGESREDIHKSKPIGQNKSGEFLNDDEVSSSTEPASPASNMYRLKSLKTSENDKSVETFKSSETMKSTETFRSVESFFTMSLGDFVDRKRGLELRRVCIIGSGNWGSVFAKVIGTNITKLESFSDEVTLFVQDEVIDGEKLSDIINETHENVKYLPGHTLPSNVIAVTDVVEAAKDAQIILFTLHQNYITSVCSALVGKIKPTAAAVCLTKGFELNEEGNIELFSQVITRILKIQTSVLMGANLYYEIAHGRYCEATIGCKDKLLAATLKDLIQSDNLQVTVVDDVDAVEVCGSLRNIIACGVGFLDGLEMGKSAKATVIRIGLIEMIKFVDLFYPGSKVSTFFESCGVSDLATCYLAGRNREISEKFITTRRSIKDIEEEMLGGLVLEGPFTASKLHFMLRERNLADAFPLFTAVHKVYSGELQPENFLDCLFDSTEHVFRLHHLTW